MYIDFFAPPRTQTVKKKHRARGSKGKGKDKSQAETSDNDGNDDAPGQSSTAFDPAYPTGSRTNMFHDAERIYPCNQDNPLMQGLLAHMLGMHFDTVVTIDDDSVFDSAGLADALPGFEEKKMDGWTGIWMACSRRMRSISLSARSIWRMMTIF